MTEKVFMLRESDDLAAVHDLMDTERVRHVPGGLSPASHL